MKYTKIELPYKYEQLEPVIDKETVEIHYEKHHTAYATKFNEGIKGTELENYSSIEELMLDYKNISDEFKPLVRNAGGGLINHNHYWKQFVNNDLDLEKVKLTWESIEKFKEEIVQKGLSVFGSGWVWLVDDNGYKIITTPNQENPWMQGIENVIIGIDVWEHAYYLKYQQARKDYLEATLELLIK